MVKREFPIQQFQDIRTPFYYYDLDVLQETLQTISSEIAPYAHYKVHYAVKACANPDVLKKICKAGFGADCVSGGEIRTALSAGFPATSIVYAGVGKADWEIELALEAGIEYFNVESIEELEIISEIAERMGCEARVSFRINPNIGAHTHANITTGLAENKFGIAMHDMEKVIKRAQTLPCIKFVGLHFHIGSQILEMDDFAALCHRINELQTRIEKEGVAPLCHINVGGGLGIDYDDPNLHPIPDFKAYFNTYATQLLLRPGQELHFELGRAIVGQCGSLITRCLYIKKTEQKQFAIVDAGMTDLIRPALYGALHQIENLSSNEAEEVYDVVGPICESSDVFAYGYPLPKTHRGDLLAIRSAGAYGEIMASQYNCRTLPKGYTSEQFREKETAK